MLQDVALAVHETSENIKIHSAHDVVELRHRQGPGGRQGPDASQFIFDSCAV